MRFNRSLRASSVAFTNSSMPSSPEPSSSPPGSFPSSIRRPPDACPGLQWGDAQQGPLHTAFEGKRPGGVDYNPMKKPGGLVLGLGGDTSNGGVGTVSAAVLSVL